MKGKAISYTELELAFVSVRRDLPRRELHRQFQRTFGRPEITVDHLKSLCTRQGWKTGRDGRFVPGQVAMNKGKSMPFHPNSARTQFKPGREPHNTKYLGHRRISKDGYVEVSVAETNPHTGYGRRYVQEHRWLWEKANGPVPDGHCLKCLDGDKTNTDPANWEALPRALLPRLNGRFGRGYDDAPAELKPTILAIAKLEHQAREAKKVK
ncbi:HNH endonuclease signature motif containing protein [Pelagovum pacificum]|uniref:HNH endonuclease n=1 Tax=Pelagovum pacificum TaxID=2588711 RepID=A0A5C5GE10_9RHOB|nr:HNH endonuclease signature motif containing protein [Pelagovum pacificum]QQA43928.1 HNH endonuclease [Pelagovum pacificum]TNY32943.1 HNH endonuclease [Pelagovum pacificum]